MRWRSGNEHEDLPREIVERMAEETEVGKTETETREEPARAAS